MKFDRSDYMSSIAGLIASRELEPRAIGENFLMDENVSPERLSDFEGAFPALPELREAATAYFKTSVEGTLRGHRPSTFDPALNSAALHPVTMEPNQTIVRLERVDSLFTIDNGFTFDRLKAAIAVRDKD